MSSVTLLCNLLVIISESNDLKMDISYMETIIAQWSIYYPKIIAIFILLTYKGN